MTKKPDEIKQNQQAVLDLIIRYDERTDPPTITFSMVGGMLDFAGVRALLNMAGEQLHKNEIEQIKLETLRRANEKSTESITDNSNPAGVLVADGMGG